MTTISSNSPELSSKIGKSVFVITTWTLCALALLTVVLRTVVRNRTHRTIQADDCLLFVSSACLLATTAFVQTRHERLYETTRRNLNLLHAGSIPELYDIVHYDMTSNYVFAALMWTSIFTAKFAYLVFFRRLVLRIKPLIIFWWVITAVIVIAYVLSATSAAIFCPWTDLRALKCIAPNRYAKSVMIPQVTTALDIMIDVLIVVLAVMILVKLKIRNSQKAGLALFLCLSAILAAIAIVRIAHSQVRRLNGTITTDTPWMYFWAMVEASMEICFVSLTAFRSFFVLRERKRLEAQEKRGWYGSTVRFLRQRRGNDTDEKEHLPFIPSGTLTGLKSFFRKGDFGGTWGDMTESEKRMLTTDEESHQSNIIVTKTFQTVAQRLETPTSYGQPHALQSHFNSQAFGTTLPTYQSEISSPAPSYHTSRYQHRRHGSSI